MKRTVLAAFSITFAAIIVNGMVSASAPSGQKLDILKVGKLVVGGDPGKPSIVLQSDSDRSEILLLDKMNEMRCMMSQSKNGALFAMTRADGKSSVTITVDDSDDSILFDIKDHLGNSAVQIVSGKTGHVVMTKDSEGAVKTAQGFVNGAIVDQGK